VGNFNAPFRGLVNFLESTTDGRAPDTWVGTLQSIIDVEKFIALNKRERLIGGPVAAGGFVGPWAPTFLTVLPNEALLLLNMSIQATIPIGLQARISPAVQMPHTFGGGTTAFKVGQSAFNSLTVIAADLRAYMDVAPFLIPPGAVCGGLTEEISALTAFNAFVTIDFVRVRL